MKKYFSPDGNLFFQDGDDFKTVKIMQVICHGFQNHQPLIDAWNNNTLQHHHQNIKREYLLAE